jgi:putative PIN family toxin of toxin-antitoxin system
LRLVIDTNVAVSGLLWGGPPNRILKWSRDKVLEIMGCDETVSELRKVLQYRKLVPRLSALGTSSNELVAYFMNLVTFMPSPTSVPEIIRDDPFDNIFLALAAEGRVHLIISGDKHLLDLKEHEKIQIVTPSEGTRIIKTFGREKA